MPKTLSTRPPVTVLCGFLGAGKTTLLNHLLTQSAGARWAVVVNDVAAINIDAAVVRAAEGTREVVELGNGCVCCSSKDALAETIAELAATGEYAHILVETTGVAEPRGIGNLFVQKNPFGRALSDFAALSSLVSVIDAAFFLREWNRYQQDGGQRKIITGTERPVFELMMEQVECADILVLNKVDLTTAEEQLRLEEIIRGLNARAELVHAEHGRVDRDFLLGSVRFDATATLDAATWLRTLNALAPGANTGDLARNERTLRPGAGSFVAKTGGKPIAVSVRPAHETKYGVRSVVYQARRPFVGAKFYAMMETRMPGLLRAKGFFWLRDRPDEMGFVSLAGGLVRYDFLSYWWAAMVESGKVGLDQRPESIRARWREPHGDRRQELVFIGVGLSEITLRSELDACLSED
jgi:G3E family GTPase